MGLFFAAVRGFCSPPATVPSPAVTPSSPPPSPSPPPPSPPGDLAAPDGPEPPATRGRRPLLLAVQAAVAGGLLFWLLREPATREALLSGLRSARPLWLLAGLGTGLVWLLACSLRWQLYLRLNDLDLPLHRVFRIYTTGQFFELFLPGSLSGDAVRWLYASRRPAGASPQDRRTARANAARAILMDHFSGLLAAAAIAAALVFPRWRWFAESPVGVAGLVFLAGFFAFSLGGLALTWLADRRGWTQRLPRFVPGRVALIGSAAAVGRFVREWPTALRGAGLSLVSLLAYYLGFCFAAQAYAAEVTPAELVSVMPVIDTVSSLPISIAGLGVREAVFERLLGELAGLPAGTAVLVSLTGFSFTLFWSLVGGVAWLTLGARPQRPREDERP